MCHYVTLIAPTEDADALRAVMAKHGRAASPIDNPSVGRVLVAGERQFLTTRGRCDCGSVLAPRRGDVETFEARLAGEAVTLARKRWPAAKIARALEDRRRAAARPSGGGADSIELWTAALRDLRATLRLPYAGLMIRFYGGSVATEAFTATRREAPRGQPLNEALSAMREDEVTLFRLG